MDPHKLSEARSLAYHRVIASKIKEDPSILDRARRRVQSWLTEQDPPRHYAKAWDETLRNSTREITVFLVAETEQAIELRQSTPFAGALSARERWAIWRSLRDGEGNQHDPQ